MPSVQLANKPSLRFCDPLLWLALSLVFVPKSESAIVENIGTSAVAMSLGNAVTADPPGIVEAVHYNPAGLSNYSGNWRSGSLFFATATPEARFSAPDGFDIGGWDTDPVAGLETGPAQGAFYLPIADKLVKDLPILVAPNFGVSFNKPDSAWTFAIAFYPQQGIGLDREKERDDPSRFSGKALAIQRIAYFTPSVSYRYSDTLSVGISIPISHNALVLETDARFPNKLFGIAGQIQEGWCGENGNPLDVFGFGLCGGGEVGRLNPFEKAATMSFKLTAPADVTFNLGVLWEPNDWFALGGVYQGGSDPVLTGDYSIQTEPMIREFVRGMSNSLLGPLAEAIVGFPTSIPEDQSGKVSIRLSFPERFQLGVKIRPTDRVQINLDLMWTNWKLWDEFTFEFDEPITVLELARLFGSSDASKVSFPRGYKSVIHYGIGLQFDATDDLVFRAGYEPRKSSIPESKFDLIAPLPDINIFSVGARYTSPKGLQIDLSAGYGKGKFNIPANGSCNLNCDHFFNLIYNPYAGLNVEGSIELKYFGLTLSKRI